MQGTYGAERLPPLIPGKKKPGVGQCIAESIIAIVLRTDYVTSRPLESGELLRHALPSIGPGLRQASGCLYSFM